MFREHIKRACMLILLVPTSWLLVGPVSAENVWVEVEAAHPIVSTDAPSYIFLSGRNNSDSPVAVDVYLAATDTWGDWWFLGLDGQFTTSIGPWVSGLVLPPRFQALDLMVKTIMPTECNGAMGRHGRYTVLAGLLGSGGAQILAMSHSFVCRIRHDERHGGLEQNHFTDIAFSEDGQAIWASSWDGIYRFDRASGNYTSFRETEGLPGVMQSDDELQVPVYNLTRDEGGSLWACVTNGIAKCESGEWTCWTNEMLGVDKKLSAIEFRPPSQSRLEEVWLGTDWFGLTLPETDPGFYRGQFDDLHYLRFLDFEISVSSGDGIGRMYFDSDRLAWIDMSWRMLVSDGTTVEWPVDSHGDPMPSDRITGFAEAPDGRKFFGSNDGLIIYDSDRWEVLTPDDSGLPGIHVEDLAFDGSGMLWLLSGPDPCLVSFDGVSEWTTFELGPASGTGYLGSALVRIDSLDVKWVCQADNNGITSFDGANWRRYRVGFPRGDEAEFTSISVK